jgi:hypothetical protein
MRVRRFANTERIRSKERRLGPVLHRRDLALLMGALPKGVLTGVSHTTTGTTSTVHTPLRALVDVAEETWRVDFADVPDPTGGFDDVVIPAGKQIGELKEDAVVSFAGQPVGTYVVYAQHSLEDENAEQRDPPGKYAGGTGVFPEHRTFFGHSQADGTPIPREGYDSTLEPEVVSEAVDRLTIAYALAANVPANATPLIEVVWDGTSVVSSEVIARELDLTDLYDHIGAGDTAHAVATTTTAGFMSAADKAKLDAATSSKTANTLAMRDPNGRIRVDTPSHDDDAANKGYVDNAASNVAIGGNVNALYRGRVTWSGTTPTLIGPATWSITRNDTQDYTITHNLNTQALEIYVAHSAVGTGVYTAHAKPNSANTFRVTFEIAGEAGTTLELPFSFLVVM